MATASDLYLSGSGALTTSGATTTLSNLFVLPGPSGSIIDAPSCTLIVSNPSGVGQTITSGSLQFSDTVGGVTSTLTYALPGTVSIAAGANQTFQIPLTSGILKNVALSVTFGGTPTAGTLSALLVLHSSQILSADTSGNTQVVGNVASGTTDSGNPVKVGGVGSSTAPTAVTNGQRQNFWLGLPGQAFVTLTNTTGATAATIGSPADSAGGAAGLEIVGQNLIFNGATWDKRRTPLVFKTLSAVTITNETTIWTPTSGKKFRLMGGLVSMGTAAGNVTLRDNTAGSTIFIIPKAPLDTPVSLNAMGNGILSAAANNVLTAQGASTETISGVVWGSEE